ncbi:NAD(P)/FAD-dependent oxidoreductase [Saccharibacillus sp. CPCC 101409]|uniref:dihydrolipoyl dehydrogenase family protein n=1 Tax=Saccharibacillus sp. CPCC 101409 TaxID=3058041 RepID=UPI002673020E|nr:NAD(P)/FAD-dependent oxidoreductase [Saccharibacillus sp. CPCC 101409]MDO3412740.1 NAD(P)/FAD-dependent oxidoreductase [Saccharibacillus sp. CPCC 101409]
MTSSAETNFDILFIGSGQAAWNAALPLAKAGKKVAIVERHKIAGVCTSYGCNPKIILDGPIKTIEDARLYGGKGLDSTFSLDWPTLMRHKNSILDPLPDKLGGMLEEAGVTIVRGEAKFADERTVVVNGEKYRADKFVIAAGQRPAMPDIPGKELLKTSDDFLYLPELPGRIVLIGAGYVAMEIASIASKAGARVEVVQTSDSVLEGFHQPYADKLVGKMREDGVTFHFGDRAASVERRGGELVLTTENGLSLAADLVVNATGRIPNTEGLGLEEAGVDYTEKGIVVDEHLRTSQPHIYASGDVLDKKQPRLTPTSVFEAKYLGGLLSGAAEAPIDYPPIATIAFTLPRITQIGVTPEEAEQVGGYTVKPVELGQEWDFAGRGDTDAHLTLVYDGEGRLAGAAAYSREALDIVNALTPVIALKLSAEQADRLIYAFPSFESKIPTYLHQAERPE